MYTIISERPKSFRLETSEGIQFWIQRHWLRADGTLTPAGEKARIEAEDGAAEREVEVSMPIAWASEKAVGVDYLAEFTLSSSVDAKPRRIRAFFPKSAITIDGNTAKIPTWLEKAKRAEALEREQQKGLHNGYSIVSAWGA